MGGGSILTFNGVMISRSWAYQVSLASRFGVPRSGLWFLGDAWEHNRGRKGYPIFCIVTSD
jgi:hypothetical protein